MKYKRQIKDSILDNIGKKPILVLYGARQVGKTTLVKDIMSEFKNPLYIQGDDPKDILLITNRSGLELSTLIHNHDLVIIDEAQKVQNIGNVLKLIADNNTKAKVIATGSSSFELANKISEPLTGRNRKFHMYPLSLAELIKSYDIHHVEKSLEDYMIFGTYPQIINESSRKEKALLIKELANDYLFKDLFIYGDIRNVFAFEKLVKLLAINIGSEISYVDLAKEIGISRDTVMNYITLLQQSFIIFRLTPMYNNKNKEINKKHKIYFYDLGMRNAILGATDPLDSRADKGAVFENFFIAEMLKQRIYNGATDEMHFWRDRQGAEIDFIECDASGQNIKAIECKWNTPVSINTSFANSYPEATFQCITKNNIVAFFKDLSQDFIK